MMTDTPHSPHPPDETAWKYWPQCWYVVGRSSQLAPGQVLSGQLGGRAWVLYRTDSGCIQAADAFCPHMGAHLRSAGVAGEALVCGLHACRLSPQTALPDTPAANITPGCQIPIQAWPCAERFGLLWLHVPAADVPPLPFAETETGHHWLGAGPERIAADWRAMICNGFDLAHMQVVHQREVVGKPQFERLPQPPVLRMTYRTRVLQRGGLSSWLMKKLSGGQLDLAHTCAGSTIMVESRVGRFRTTGIFALLPQADSATAPEQRATLAFAAVGIPTGARLPRLQLYLARFLYLAFLRKDFTVVEHMRLKLDGVDDPGVQAVAAYQAGLHDLETRRHTP